jgi:hypothetical protein
MRTASAVLRVETCHKHNLPIILCCKPGVEVRA